MRWYNETAIAKKVAIIGGGLSLRGVDFFRMKRDGFIIAINDAWRGFERPNIVFTIDTVNLRKRFDDCRYKVVIAAPDDYGKPDAKHLCDQKEPNPRWHYMERRLEPGLAKQNYAIHSGENSAYGALNFAYHMQPEAIYLFGIDMVDMGSYWHDHCDLRPQNGEVCRRVPDNFKTTLEQLARAGIKVYNCSPISAITCFEKITPQDGIGLWNE